MSEELRHAVQTSPSTFHLDNYSTRYRIDYTLPIIIVQSYSNDLTTIVNTSFILRGFFLNRE